MCVLCTICFIRQTQWQNKNEPSHRGLNTKTGIHFKLAHSFVYGFFIRISYSTMKFIFLHLIGLDWFRCAKMKKKPISADLI